MANYIKGEKNFYPDIKPFTPDYKFLSAALDAREAKYQAGWKATNDIYSRVYSDLSHESNKQFQQQFIENLAPELARISGLDLSLQRNVDAAKSVFAPFFEDDAVVKDIVYTSTYKNEMQRANTYANSPIAKVRELWNPIGIKNMQYRMQEFKDADRDQLINMPLPKYIEDADLKQYAQDYLRSLGLKGEGFTQTKEHFQIIGAGKDGVFGTADDKVNPNFIITDTNGELIRGDAYRRVMADLTDDPRVQQFYDAKAYVASMEFAEEGVNNGTVKTMQEGVNMWAKNEVERINLLNHEKYNDLDQEIKTLVQQTTSWQNYGKVNGLLPSEEKYVNTTLSEVEQLRVNLEELIGVNEFANSEDADDQALISKAYSLNKNFNITTDLQSAAYDYSRENSERKIRENKFILDEKKYQYELGKIAAKLQADKVMEEIKQKNKLELEERKAELKGIEGGSFTSRVQSGTTTSLDDATSALYTIEDDELAETLPTTANTNAILEDQRALLQQKINLIPKLLKERYGTETFTVTLGGETKEYSPQRLLELLNTKKEVADGTQIKTLEDQYEYLSDIERMFEEQQLWFGNRDNVKLEKGPDYIAPGTNYSQLYSELFENNPNDPTKLGVVRKQELFNDQLARYEEVLHNKAEAAHELLLNEEDDYKEMMNAGYPKPYVEVNGVKQLMPFTEYQKLFIQLAQEGKIKNFDPSGFGDSSAGGSRPDWKKIQMKTAGIGNDNRPFQDTSTTYEEVWDFKSMKGKAKRIWDLLNTKVNDSYNKIGGESYITLSRDLDPNVPFTDLGAVPTQSTVTSTKPEGGSEQDILLATALTQYNAARADATTRPAFLMRPDDIKDLNKIDIKAGVKADDKYNIASQTIFNMLFDPNTKGTFRLTYYPNVGATVKEGEEESTPMGGYSVTDFSPEFKKYVRQAYPGDEGQLVVNSVLNNGVFMVYDRTGDKDISPNSLNRIQGTSFIDQKMNLNKNGVYKYDYDGNVKAGFSPGSAIYQDMGDGTISHSYIINEYNPNSTDINKQYISTRIDLKPIKKAGNMNYQADLDSRFNQVVQILAEQDNLNNLAMYQQRALNLNETKFIEAYMQENPNATEDEAKSVYTGARELPNNQ